jgi:hypothetical protein
MGMEHTFGIACGTGSKKHECVAFKTEQAVNGFICASFGGLDDPGSGGCKDPDNIC